MESNWRPANRVQFTVKNQTAVIIGGARGLGLGFAQVVDENGTNVAVLDIIPPDTALDRMKTDYGVEIEYYKTDVTRRDEVNQVLKRIEKDIGDVNIKWARFWSVPMPEAMLTRAGSINAAGVVKDEPVLTASDKAIAFQFFVNVRQYLCHQNS